MNTITTVGFAMPIDRTHHVLVKLPPSITPMERGPLLMDMELWLRERTGKPCEVFLETMRDLNKLRRELKPGDHI